MVLCFSPEDRPKLKALYERGLANGVEGLSILERDEALALEPALNPQIDSALLAETSGIVCPFEMTLAFAENAYDNGVCFRLGRKVGSIEKDGDGYTVEAVKTDFAGETARETYHAKVIVNCAGVHADEIHGMVSAVKQHIQPRRGQYYLLDKQAGSTVSRTIFQLPNAMGKGVLVTPTIHGNLMIGPTGSGKTYLVKTLARLLDVPLAIADATSLTEAGYIGDDIESVISKLLAAADNDVKKAETGIVFIDEIDKLARKKETNHRDVNGESVQQGLLKLLEGAKIEVPVGASSKNAMVPMETVDTTNILFICGGAFPDLDQVIKERLAKKTSMGFNAELKDKYEEDRNILQKVEVEDLRKFGMIPEFLGRLPIVYALDAPGEQMLVRILKEPKNALLRQYEKLLEMDEVKLDFEDDALEIIAKKALEKGTGARALRAVLDSYMLDIMYEIPKDPLIGSVTITKAYLEGTGGPIIRLRGQQDDLPQG